MVGSFNSKTAEDIFHGYNSRYARMIPLELKAKICRLLDQLNAAKDVYDMGIPPGNRLERLQGDLKNKWSVRINKQWRIIFAWDNGIAKEVDIVDYH